jgi:hypothetical protein
VQRRRKHLASYLGLATSPTPVERSRGIKGQARREANRRLHAGRACVVLAQLSCRRPATLEERLKGCHFDPTRRMKRPCRAPDS